MSVSLLWDVAKPWADCLNWLSRDASSCILVGKGALCLDDFTEGSTCTCMLLH